MKNNTDIEDEVMKLRQARREKRRNIPLKSPDSISSKTIPGFVRTYLSLVAFVIILALLGNWPIINLIIWVFGISPVIVGVIWGVKRVITARP